MNRYFTKRIQIVPFISFNTVVLDVYNVILLKYSLLISKYMNRYMLFCVLLILFFT